MFAASLVAARVVGGRTWRIHKRSVIVACALGAAYGYLMELDERRKASHA
jgi:hypothetical protein